MDRLAAEFEEIGLKTTPQNLARDGRMGRMIRVGNAEICFGIEDDDETVILTDYRRVDQHLGLRLGFEELLWFIEFIIARPQLGLLRLHGLIRPDRAGAIGPDRLAISYRLLGGRFERMMNGEEWMALEFKDYRRLRRTPPNPALTTGAATHG